MKISSYYYFICVYISLSINNNFLVIDERKKKIVSCNLLHKARKKIERAERFVFLDYWDKSIYICIILSCGKEVSWLHNDSCRQFCFKSGIASPLTQNSQLFFRVDSPQSVVVFLQRLIIERRLGFSCVIVEVLKNFLFLHVFVFFFVGRLYDGHRVFCSGS